MKDLLSSDETRIGVWHRVRKFVADPALSGIVSLITLLTVVWGILTFLYPDEEQVLAQQLQILDELRDSASKPAMELLALKNVPMNSISLKDADITMSNLHNAILSYARINNSNFYGSDLSNVDFSGATVRGSNFDYTNLTGAKFDKSFENQSSGNTFTGAVLPSDAAVRGFFLENTCSHTSAKQEFYYLPTDNNTHYVPITACQGSSPGTEVPRAWSTHSENALEMVTQRFCSLF